MSTLPHEAVRRPLMAVVWAALGLVLARVIWPDLNFDGTSLVLFAIAAAAWALAYLPISRFKAGDYEIELVRTVTALKQRVREIEAADRVAAELERTVIASEVAAVPAPRAEDAETRVMRGGWRPDETLAAPESAGRPASGELVREYRAILDSPVPDREKVMRAVALAERATRDARDPDIVAAIATLRTMRDTIAGGGAELSPRMVNPVLVMAWRLIRAADR